MLIVEDNAAEQLSISELLGHDDIEIVTAETGSDALRILRMEPCDCVVLDLRLPDMTGFEILESLRADAALSDVPVVVFTGRELSAEEDAQLHTMARSIVVKGVEFAGAAARRDIAVPAPGGDRSSRRKAEDARAAAPALMRTWLGTRSCSSMTTPATSSRSASVLERRGMRVLTATTGGEAIELVESTPDVAIVLMDIMMPEMDGYQTIGAIRKTRHFAGCRSSR